MPSRTPFAALAAFVQCGTAIASLVVAVGYIGLDALASPEQMLEAARRNPLAFQVQDGLKFVAAAALGVLLWALHRRLRSRAPRLVNIATSCGAFSLLLLLSNACGSLYLLSGTPDPALATRLNGVIGILALGAIFFGGLWYLLHSLTALRHGGLPRGLARLGFGIGLISLLPILGLLVLVLTIPWSLWLGRYLLREAGASRAPSGGYPPEPE